MKTFKEYLQESKNIEHEFIKQELGNKGYNVEKIEPAAKKSYMDANPKQTVHISNLDDNEELNKATKHLAKLGLDKEYTAVHATKISGSSPSVAVKRAGNTHAWAGD